MSLMSYDKDGGAIAWAESMRDACKAAGVPWFMKQLGAVWAREHDAGQTRRVAARFALVAAAGELATRAGVTGWPVGTFVRGRRVMWQGELLTPSTGEPVRFLEALKA